MVQVNVAFKISQGKTGANFPNSFDFSSSTCNSPVVSLVVHLIEKKTTWHVLWFRFLFVWSYNKLLHSGAFCLNTRAGSPCYTCDGLTSESTFGSPEKWWLGDDLFLWGRPMFSWGELLVFVGGSWISGSFNQSRHCRISTTYWIFFQEQILYHFDHVSKLLPQPQSHENILVHGEIWWRSLGGWFIWIYFVFYVFGVSLVCSTEVCCFYVWTAGQCGGGFYDVGCEEDWAPFFTFLCGWCAETIKWSTKSIN